MLKKIWKDQEGATMAEYALLLAFIAVVVLVAVQSLGTNVSERFEVVASSVGPS